jgi:A/G-specific adenine glycosylase
MARTLARPAAFRFAELRKRVLKFYRGHRRDLPWRHTRNPYHILVSEVMLQQTQVQRVIPKYRAFLKRFPTTAALARARFADVLQIWIGLGYNGRALRLWRCATEIVHKHGGRIPRDPDELERLPGIGPYTAAAVASFAFGAHVPVVDTNVRRVLKRTLLGRDGAPAAHVLALAERAAAHGQSGRWAQALMDVGARFCRSTPKCELCPVRTACAYARAGRGPLQRGAARSPSAFVGSDRFYRGRVVRLLALRQSVAVSEIGRQVKENFGATDRVWFRRLLNGLARDGLIVIDRTRQRICLP